MAPQQSSRAALPLPLRLPTMPAKTTPFAQTQPPSAAQHALLDNRFTDADGFYEALMDAHSGLDTAQSALLNARLILLLANQIGDSAVLADCIALAQHS